MIAGLSMPLGIALFGPLGDVIKIEILLVITGILLVIGSFAILGRKELIQAGKV
jgi:DHA3 family macrolide efflux protein-like MFS transporter